MQRLSIFSDCLVVVGSIAAGIIATASTVSHNWIIAPSALIAGAVYLKYHAALRSRTEICVAHLSLLYSELDFPARAEVRSTLHIVRRRWLVGPRAFFQASNYVPDGEGLGRRFSTKRGIISRAYSQRESFVDNFADQAEYERRMVSDYGYTPEEAAKHKVDRRSYFCFPVLDHEGNNVLAVFYFDSPHVDTFPVVGRIDKRGLLERVMRRLSELVR